MLISYTFSNPGRASETERMGNRRTFNMPLIVSDSFSTIPAGQERRVDPKRRVDLLAMLDVLLATLTPSLCQTVFQRFRSTERERKWTFTAVAQFWTAVIIRHPAALQHGLDETRKGRSRDKLWPRVMATAQAFFEKCSALRPHLFKALYDEFTVRIVPQAVPGYASWLGSLRERFPEIQIVDGSHLDAICRRLKLLRTEPLKVLPGSVTAFYDLFRGITRQVWFYPNAAEAELPRAEPALARMARGTLLIGDRLYASIHYFLQLSRCRLWGLIRLNPHLKIDVVKTISRRQGGGRAFLEELLVKVGSGVEQPKILLRLIRYRERGRRLDLLTNVLDSQQLTPEEAVSLYGLRWSIERLFFDLKDVLSLHSLYASHPNLVAQQVYAAAIVHTAFRVAQAGIAAKARVLPEQVSPAKLFPKLAQATADYCVLQWSAIETRALNPGVRIAIPDFHRYPSTYTWLRTIIVRSRSSPKHKRRYVERTKRWKSFAHVRGGRKLLESVSVN
jgi:hypothetical protein